MAKSRTVVKGFEGPDWVQEKLPKKVVPQLFHSDHRSAPYQEELKHVDGKKRREQVRTLVGPSKLVEDHILDLNHGLEVRLPNGATFRIGPAGKDHLEVSVSEGPDTNRSARTITVCASASNTVFIGCQDWVNTTTPKLEDL